MTIRRMSYAELARASWAFWFWCAIFGANSGFLIGEVFIDRRWYFVLLHLFAAMASLYAAQVERHRSSARITAFYDTQMPRRVHIPPRPMPPPAPPTWKGE